MFTTEEAFEDPSLTVTRKTALRMLKDHPNGSSFEDMREEFFQDNGSFLHYSAKHVLEWLGY